MELLEMIADQVAAPNAYERSMRYTSISKHLFKMRLVCRAFAKAVMPVFLNLVDNEDYDEYRTIYLPPKSGDLALLRATVTHPNSILPDLITDVSYEIVTARQAEVDEGELVEYLEDIGLVDQCLEVSERLADMNFNLFRKQSRRQNRFAHQLGSVAGKRAMKAIMSSLWNLCTVEIHVQDFWDDASVGLTESAAESDAVASLPYTKGIPALLECISGSETTQLDFIGFGSHAFGGLSPTRIAEIGAKLAFRHITVLHLYIGHHDDVEFNDFVDDGLLEKPLRRSDRVNFLLSRMKLLHHLTLHCDDVAGETEWLSDVLQDQAWPGLTGFSLYNFNATRKPLLDFLVRHKKTLKTMSLLDINMVADGWVKLLPSIRDDLKLSKASIYLDTDSQVAQKAIIAHIIKLHGMPLEYPKNKVDIGAYVVKPHNKDTNRAK